MVCEQWVDFLILLFDTAHVKARYKANSDNEKQWQKTQYANLIRYIPSGTYYARLRVAGKLIRKSLKTQAVKVYGHLRDQHSVAMAQKVWFSHVQSKNIQLPEQPTPHAISRSTCSARAGHSDGLSHLTQIDKPGRSDLI
jgi:hypothetical protein